MVTRFDTKRRASPSYTLFQNGRHLNILLFLFKLALDASFLSLKFKRIFYLERGNNGPICMRINQRPFWNKVYCKILFAVDTWCLFFYCFKFFLNKV